MENTLQHFLQLVLSFFLGAIIGAEREYIGKAAGMRTFSLVAMGSTLFTILSREGFLIENAKTDPSRIAAAIVMGLGFLLAGLIIFKGEKVEGLTTAAALWSTAAIGMAVGCQFYLLAFLTTIFIFLILNVMKKIRLEERFKK